MKTAALSSLTPLLVAALTAAVPVAAQQAAQEGGGPDSGEPPGFEERLAGLEARPGLLDLHLDREAGKVWLELPAATGPRGLVGEYLYVEGLVSGLGSNPVGLDRGQLGRARRVQLRRLGGRAVLEELNLSYRAQTDATAERRATRESFATSVLWAAPIAATAEDGRALVDLTGFIVRDAHGVVEALRQAEQGEFRLDPERSAVDLDACLAFPQNLELEALLTFAGDKPGPLVRSTAPTGEAVTLVLHQSLLAVPPAGYRPREFDPRAGTLAIQFADYAAPLDAPLEQRWVIRHRLEREDPADPASPARRPIVYYVDPAIPEPVRGAVIEGAGWWAEAFAAAGFADGYRVELLPEGEHPLDARFNVIQWVHRSTRGWSYGGGVVDPLTGERIKGHVSLGSLRVRQDRLLFEGLLGTAATGSGAADDPVELALARIRQLAAHEVGHTLGLAHNFAASTYGRASVMDYPAPLVRPAADGGVDVSAAYAVGVGEWDVQAIRYAYTEFAPGADEAAELATIVRQGLDEGRVFLSDADARPPGAAQPLAALWDNGADPVEQLAVDMEVRRRALERFGAANVAPGQPLALLEEVFATVYLRHRYQLEAAAKVVAGLDYRYAMRGDGQGLAVPLPAVRQRRALGALLATVEPAALDVPEQALRLLLPRPYGYRPNRELFDGATAPAFDALAAAATAADLTLGVLLQPERAARLVDQHRRVPDLPGLAEVLDAAVGAIFATAAEAPRLAELRRTVQSVLVARMIDLASTAPSPAVRARVEERLARLAGTLTAATAGDPAARAHRAAVARAVERHLTRPAPAASDPPPAPPPPPGSPIGASPLVFELTGCSGPDQR